MKACEDIDAPEADGLDAGAPAAAVLLPPGPRAPARAATDAATTLALERFLREVEARAYRIALLGLRDRDDALDAVQDAMLRLVRRYARRPSEEWRPLFYRILQNRVRDLQRRRTMRTRIFGFLAGRDDDRDETADAPAPPQSDPLERATANDAMQALEQALAELPARQREAFVLRSLEGLDVAATALAMRCTEGSVKTHYSRAVSRLRVLLGAHIEDD